MAGPDKTTLRTYETAIISEKWVTKSTSKNVTYITYEFTTFELW